MARQDQRRQRQGRSQPAAGYSRFATSYTGRQGRCDKLIAPRPALSIASGAVRARGRERVGRRHIQLGPRRQPGNEIGHDIPRVGEQARSMQANQVSAPGVPISPW